MNVDIPFVCQFTGLRHRRSTCQQQQHDTSKTHVNVLCLKQSAVSAEKRHRNSLLSIRSSNHELSRFSLRKTSSNVGMISSPL